MKKGTNPDLSLVPADAVGHALSGITPLMKLQKVSGQNTEAVQERIQNYFDHCTEAQIIPTVEGLALCLGIDRRTLWEWERGNGCAYDTMETVRRAKLILQAVDAELALKQKISPVVSIFRAKNYFGMRDNVTIETDNSYIERTESPEAIMAKYEGLLLDEE